MTSNFCLSVQEMMPLFMIFLLWRQLGICQQWLSHDNRRIFPLEFMCLLETIPYFILSISSGIIVPITMVATGNRWLGLPYQPYVSSFAVSDSFYFVNIYIIDCRAGLIPASPYQSELEENCRYSNN